MRRSSGVTVIAVLSLIGSFFTLLMGLLVILVAILRPGHNAGLPPGMPPAVFTALLVLASLMYILPAIWGIFTGIGLLRLKNWARISTIVFSILLILMGGFGGLIGLLVPLPSAPERAADPSVVHAVRIAIGLFWTSLAGMGTWWLVFLTRMSVKQQFLPAQSVPVSSIEQGSLGQTAAVVSTSPVVSARPLSISIIGWWMVVTGGLFAPWSLAMQMPAILFLKVMTGWPAILFNFALAGIILCVGIGLLRLNPAARVVGIAYFAYALVNSGVFYLWPGGHARVMDLMAKQQSHWPWLRAWKPDDLQFDPTSPIIVGGVLGLALLLVAIYFLVTRKLAFEGSTLASTN